MTLLWCDNLGRRNVQETIQLCMPILVGMIAASAIRTRADLRKLFWTFSIALVFLAAFTVVFMSGKFDEEWISTRVRPASLDHDAGGLRLPGGLSAANLLAHLRLVGLRAVDTAIAKPHGDGDVARGPGRIPALSP